MNVKKVSELTGLTKKAIKFYEDKGLIKVAKNPKNNYREYSEENILKLKLIASLRVIGLSIDDIKILINGEKGLAHLLKKQYDLIDKQLKILSEKKILTQTLINNLSQSKDFIEMVNMFDITINLNELEKTEFLSDQLRRIFPGIFGEFISTVFEPFLQVKIENEREKKIWLEFVSYLDNINDIPEIHPVMQIITLDLEDKIEEFKAQNKKFISSILGEDKTTFDMQVLQIVQLVKNVETDPMFRKNFIIQTKLSADIPSFKDGTIFSNFLKEISPTYNQFLQKQRIVKETADNQLGFDSQEYLEKVVSENN